MKSRSLQWFAVLLFLATSASATVRYVRPDNANPSAPYTSWATAATNIQDAIDAAASGDQVVVTNGIYQNGGQIVYGALMNRVAVTKPLSVLSVNGPAVTIIQGTPGAVRCVYLTNGAFLSGFTLTGGGTLSSGDDGRDQSGGAVWGESTSAIASNCVISASSAGRWGGGAAFLTLLNCIVTGNSAGHGGGALSCALTNCVVTNNNSYYGGGARDSTLDHCVVNGNVSQMLGGGTMTSTLIHCALTNNTSSYSGGGANGGTLNFCFLVGNGSGSAGGGASDSALNNCTLAGNSAPSGGGASFASLNNCMLTGNSAYNNGGGTLYCGLNNCTLTGNSAPVAGGTDQSGLNNCICLYNNAPTRPNYANSMFNYSCTTPLPNGGVGNTTADPLLTDAAHLSAGSPCRGAGNAAYITAVDFDGEPWSYPPSIGCDEFHPGPVAGPLSVAVQALYTNIATGFTATFGGKVSGHATANRWEFGDGTVVSNQLVASHAWAVPGDYSVIFRAFNDSFPSGVSAMVTVHVVTQPIHYVFPGSAAPTPPYASWATAAPTIQDAVDAATVTGALVLVTNGTYQTGGRVLSGSLSNRVAVSKPLMIKSVNGPATTTIRGFQPPATTNGDSAVRCVYLANDAMLTGFTLTMGATRSDGDFFAEQSGGGVRCEPTALVSNCVLIANSANGAGGGASGGTLVFCTMATNGTAGSGGGAYDCTLNNCSINACSASDGGAVNSCGLNNCTLANNSATYGGGASSCTLNNCSVSGNNASTDGGGARTCIVGNCTLSGNSAPTGGGGSLCSLYNSILFFNSATVGANYSGGALNFCCTTPLPDAGLGNFTSLPLLSDFSHISPASPCRAAGSAVYATGFDIDGEAWANPPAVGCDQLRSGAVTGPLVVAIYAEQTNIASGFSVNLTGAISGHATSNRWDFGDGTSSNNLPYISHKWVAAGDYLVVFRAYNDSNPGGVNATVAVHVVSQPVHYVSAASATPAAPYSSWATAATMIQDAVNASSVAGALVLVSNGVYPLGGKVISGALTNRVAVNKPLFVSSVNGPSQTVIKGNPAVGDAAVRCVYLAKGAMLSGFTLTDGASRNGGDGALEQSGGGVWCEPIGVIVSNCVITGNSAAAYGGGAFSGSLYNCVLLTNSAFGGGSAYGSFLKNCTLASSSARYGGGAQSCALNECTLTNNTGSWFGGGVSESTLSRCVLLGNHGGSGGGGSQNSTLNNCLLSGNSASEGGGGAVNSTLNNCTVVNNNSGVDYCTLNNCIVYYNTYHDINSSTLNYCCTPVSLGNGSDFTNEPRFINLNSADFHLQAGSPCINAGYNVLATGSGDLDGNPRIVGGTLDVGAYEFQSPGSLISYAWLQQYGFPTDGSADYLDPDSDGLNNWKEWLAGTIPTDAGSVLRLLTPGLPTVTLRWQSVTNRAYFIERATTLLAIPLFSVVASNIPGQPGTTTFTDPATPLSGSLFYRVGVQR